MCCLCFLKHEKILPSKNQTKNKGTKKTLINLNAENIVYYNFINTKKAFSNLPVGWNMSDMNTVNKKVKVDKNWA